MVDLHIIITLSLFHGKFNYKKEEWHVHYDILPLSEKGIGSIFGRWVGFKGVVYNLPDGRVKLESYVDKQDNNHWEKADEFTDSGDWGNDMIRCGAKTSGTDNKLGFTHGHFQIDICNL